MAECSPTGAASVHTDHTIERYRRSDNTNCPG